MRTLPAAQTTATASATMSHRPAQTVAGQALRARTMPSAIATVGPAQENCQSGWPYSDDALYSGSTPIPARTLPAAEVNANTTAATRDRSVQPVAGQALRTKRIPSAIGTVS